MGAVKLSEKVKGLKVIKTDKPIHHFHIPGRGHKRIDLTICSQAEADLAVKHKFSYLVQAKEVASSDTGTKPRTKEEADPEKASK
jgi:hypothetical protein